MKNVFACLVHESPDCVVDLLDNLSFLDPDSSILLYDGSPHTDLVASLGLADRADLTVHPEPRPIVWGAIHPFAVDSMRFALQGMDVDALTIVDSDQLAVRPGYSRFLSRFLDAHPGAGCLAKDPRVQPRWIKVGPVATAWSEFDKWLPFLRRFTEGERRFPHKSFWPATVFTRGAAADIVSLFADPQLEHLMATTGIVAPEEVVLPTLAALAGHAVLRNPTCLDFVGYRVNYTESDIDRALGREDVFWVHPVPRLYDNPLRRRIRSGFGQYQSGIGLGPAAGAGAP